MNYRLWIVGIVFITAMAINGMEEEVTPLMRSPSAGANEGAYAEAFEDVDYAQNMNEALSHFAYNKEKKQKLRQQQRQALVKKLNQLPHDKRLQTIHDVVELVRVGNSSYFSFMSEEEFDKLRAAGFSWLKLPSYRARFEEEYRAKIKEIEKNPTLKPNEKEAILTSFKQKYLDWKEEVDQKENQLKAIIWRFIEKYPDQF